MRYTIVSPVHKIENEFQVEFDTSFSPIYHARIGMQLPVIVSHEKKYIVYAYHWGLTPHWFRYKSNVQQLHTAWASDLVKNQYFRVPIRKQRCLVPVNCLILHIQTKGGKKPYLFYLKNEKLFCIAGLWDCWKNTATGGGHHSFSIIQNVAPRRLRKIVPAFPVIIPHGRRRRFLDPDTHLNTVMHMLAPYESHLYNLYPISPEPLEQGINDKSILMPTGERVFTEHAHAEKTYPMGGKHHGHYD